jgi:hypothetical protein
MRESVSPETMMTSSRIDLFIGLALEVEDWNIKKS